MTILQISAKIYWGFKIEVTKKFIVSNNIDDIILHMKTQMKKFFKLHNLVELLEGVDNLNLHIHNYDVEDPIIYLCDHC
jgi:hypothetical protein